jgi:hypothetical protein
MGCNARKTNRQTNMRDNEEAHHTQKISWSVVAKHKATTIHVYVAKYYIEGTVSGGQLMVAQWLSYSATNRKVAVSIPDGVIGIFR